MVAALSSSRALAALLTTCALLCALVPGAQAVPRKNPANKLLRVPVDTLTYDRATRCRKSMTKGALALVSWLQRNARGTYWGGVRCERLSGSTFSMHAEGRAIDWHLDVHNAADRREAERLLAMIFGPDSQGNENALARRMGIVEAIWDCRYYGFWMPGGQSKRYSPCTDSRGKLRGDVDPTIAHRNHIHFSLSRAGAQMRTSYWKYIWLKQPMPKLDEPIVDSVPDTEPGAGRTDGSPPVQTGDGGPPAVSPPAPGTDEVVTDDTADDESDGFYEDDGLY